MNCESFRKCPLPIKISSIPAHLLVHFSVVDVSVCIAYTFSFFRVFSFKGDEVIEWNGRSLQGKSTQEVCDVIEESRHESQIELIVSRPLSVNRKAAQTSWRQSHSPIRAQTRQLLHKGSTHLILIKKNLLHFLFLDISC